MFSPSRDEARRFFCGVWQKSQEQQPLSGAELRAADIINRHPEYHALLGNPAWALTREWTPEEGETNPFLHL
ncbi:MAG: DUF1841 family protein, partial [Zoogloeaceae bacterium]|nr:DUF1841 family protein [Zoogloeaceae bacterium]